MITDDEVRALTDYIVSLETQIGWLESKRLLYTQGPLALVARAALVEPPPGFRIGAG